MNTPERSSNQINAVIQAGSLENEPTNPNAYLRSTFEKEAEAVGLVFQDSQIRPPLAFHGRNELYPSVMLDKDFAENALITVEEIINSTRLSTHYAHSAQLLNSREGHAVHLVQIDSQKEPLLVVKQNLLVGSDVFARYRYVQEHIAISNPRLIVCPDLLTNGVRNNIRYAVIRYCPGITLEEYINTAETDDKRKKRQFEGDILIGMLAKDFHRTKVHGVGRIFNAADSSFSDSLNKVLLKD